MIVLINTLKEYKELRKCYKCKHKFDPAKTTSKYQYVFDHWFYSLCKDLKQMEYYLIINKDLLISTLLDAKPKKRFYTVDELKLLRGVGVL